MTAEETPSELFKRDYQALELDDSADWETARNKYRHLVHHWHPDRYTQRPREKAHAQQQFILLTKSYNSLRNFYRTNQRLPFEEHKESIRSRSESAFPGEEEIDQAQEPSSGLHKGVLNRDPKSRPKRQLFANLSSKFWIFAALTMMIATVAASMVLDLNANKANIEKGREVLRHAPASDFMPSPAEIRKSQTRGAFVQPTR